MQWNIFRLSCLAMLGWGICGPVAQVRADGPVATPATPAAAEPAASAELGIWVWQYENVVEDARREALFAFCKEHGFGRMLLQIKFGPDEEGILRPDRLRKFLAEAARVPIKVEALDGDPELGLETHRERALHRLASVLALHCSQPDGQGFVGVHYDIEPYLIPRWRGGDMPGVALETLALLSAIQQAVRAAAPALTIAYDIPHWYGNKDELMLEYGGRRQNFHRHIQDLSDYVGIMSYRRAVTGPKSVTDISRPILAYAAGTGKKAYVSLETAPLKQDTQISFSGTSPGLLFQTIDQLRDELKGSPGFGGILLHDYRHLRELLEAPVVKAEAQP